MILPEYTTAEKRFGIESHLPVVLMVTGRESHSRFEEVTIEKTNLQPRPRLAATLPTRPGHPTRLEHGYQRAGALHLFAAFDTRTGKVYARTEGRKRQKEFIALLTQLDREIPPSIRRIWLALDNSSVHKGK